MSLVTAAPGRRTPHPLGRRARRLVIALELLIGSSAIYGGVRLLADAGRLGVDEAWLDGSPFSDYTIPGIVLLVVVGGGLLGAALASWRRPGLAGPAALAAGATLLGWGAVETAVIGYQGPAQIVLLFVFVGPGVVLAELGARSLV